MSRSKQIPAPSWFVYWALTYVMAFAVVGLLPFAAGIPGPKFLGASTSLPFQFFYLVINAAIQGLVLGLGQWLLLRKLDNIPVRMAFYTCAGWVIGLSIGLLVVFGLSHLIPDPSKVSSQSGVTFLNITYQLFNGLPFFLAGLVLGRFQGIEMRSLLEKSNTWPVVSGLSFLLFLVVRNIFTFLGGMIGPLGFGSTLGLWIASLIPGLVTAAFLARVRRQESLGRIIRSGAMVQPLLLIFISLVLAFMAAEVGDAIEYSRSIRPDSIELMYESGLPADGRTEIYLQAVIRNRDGQALVGQNVKFEIMNRDTFFMAEDGSQGIMPVDEGCIVLEEAVCLPSAIVQSSPEGIAEVLFRLPVWEGYMDEEPVRFEARVFRTDPEAAEGPVAAGEIFLFEP